MDVERVDFVSVITLDLDRAKTFYGETLGLPRNPNASDAYPEFETGNLTIALVTARDAEAFQPSMNSISLRVPNVKAARAELEGTGVAFDGQTLDTGVCHMAFFHDPDGNSLMLHRRYAPYSDGSLP